MHSRFRIFALLLASAGLVAQSGTQPLWIVHPAPDENGIYCAGPEVSAPNLLRIHAAAYPTNVRAKEVQGMTVLAMVISPDGTPDHIQVLHSHGDAYDQAAIAAVNQSTFAPGKLAGKAVPVWIDVRVAFRSNLAQAWPQVLITERDLPSPGESYFTDKRQRPVTYTPPVPIHTVDADFADPYGRDPITLVAHLTVTVGIDGLPQHVQLRRGLTSGLDKKAIVAVEHYRFLPATKHGKPVVDDADVTVDFSKF
jgi:TonB family protein